LTEMPSSFANLLCDSRNRVRVAATLIVSLVRRNAFLGEKAVDSISPLW
jgi:hypothetical protein